MARLEGRTVALFLAPAGTEQVEFVEPRRAIESAGGTVEVLGAEKKKVQAVNKDLEPGDSFQIDKTFAQANVDEYDALVIPGGTIGADKLRANADAVELIRRFEQAGKPIAVICHGPWTLVEAGLAKGRTLTSYPSLKADIRNAGGEWVDQEVVVDRGVITSRNPDDLPAFCDKLLEAVERAPARA